MSLLALISVIPCSEKKKEWKIVIMVVKKVVWFLLTNESYSG